MVVEWAVGTMLAVGGMHEAHQDESWDTAMGFALWGDGCIYWSGGPSKGQLGRKRKKGGGKHGSEK